MSELESPVPTNASPARPDSQWSPGTPKPPIAPPRRRSSLHFSQLLSSSDLPMEPPRNTVVCTPSSNVGRKRTHDTPFLRNAATASHNTQIRRIFQDANAMMQLDVAYASSPAGSIGTRLSHPQSPSLGGAWSIDGSNVMPWRYSTAPQLFAQTDLDVREPFPAAEPLSSGFTTPNEELALPPLPNSSPPANINDEDARSEAGDSALDVFNNYARLSTKLDLDQPLSDLHIGQMPRVPSSNYDETILAESLCSSLKPSLNLDIFCSPAAKAAADSARLKRGLDTLEIPRNKEDNIIESRCPDPSIHRYTPQYDICPDPAVHRHIPRHDAGLFPPGPPYRRADSKGSPLPPLKARYHPYKACSSPPQDHELPTLPRPPLQSYFSSPSTSEHFQPGWSNHSVPEDGEGPVYSFSTAAAKVTGSSPAPDSRIRDSYRTDTLTPLSKPSPRFRKTGIGALTQRGSRQYGPPGGRRGTMPPIGRRQFTSSPPKVRKGYKRIREDARSARSDEDVVMKEAKDGAENVVVRELSPNVMPFRKGREPKRPRSVSYWDKDILDKVVGPETGRQEGEGAVVEIEMQEMVM